MFNKKTEPATPPQTPPHPVVQAPRKPGEDVAASHAAPRSGAPESAPTSSASRFSPRLSRPQGSGSTSSIMNPHLSFEGDLRYTGTVTVDCELHGSITTEDTLVIGPSGKVEAEICAGIVEISGKLRGNVHAKTRVKIFTGGEVYGNIETPTVAMEEGVVFEGHCTRPQGAPAAHAPHAPANTVQKVLEGAASVLSGPADPARTKDPSAGSTSPREAELTCQS